MKKVKINLSLLILLIAISKFNSYSSELLSEIDPKTDEKVEFILQLVNNPDKFDSLLHNSEFYHPEISKKMDSEKIAIIEFLKEAKIEAKDEFKFDDSIYFDKYGKKILTHDFGLTYNLSNNIGIFFILENSKWYLKKILPFNDRIEIKNNYKLEFLTNLIRNSTKYDSIISNSNSYHPEFTKKLLERKSLNIDLLNKLGLLDSKNQKVVFSSSFISKDNYSHKNLMKGYSNRSDIYVRSMTIYFDTTDIRFNYNVFSIEFFYLKSKFYLNSWGYGSNDPDDIGTDSFKL